MRKRIWTTLMAASWLLAVLAVLTVGTAPAVVGQVRLLIGAYNEVEGDLSFHCSTSSATDGNGRNNSLTICEAAVIGPHDPGFPGLFPEAYAFSGTKGDLEQYYDKPVTALTSGSSFLAVELPDANVVPTARFSMLTIPLSVGIAALVACLGLHHLLTVPWLNKHLNGSVRGLTTKVLLSGLALVTGSLILSLF